MRERDDLVVVDGEGGGMSWFVTGALVIAAVVVAFLYFSGSLESAPVDADAPRVTIPRS